LMKYFTRKTTGIRKGTSQKNGGLFSDLLHKSDWSNLLINMCLSYWSAVIGMCIVNKTQFMLIFI
jgi:hypothetical protein